MGKIRDGILLRQIRWELLLGGCILFVMGCQKPSPSEAESKLRVIVSILPQAYLVDRIAGPHAETIALLGPGQSEHTYDPTPRQIAQLASASILFRIGMPIEETIVRKAEESYPYLKIVDGRQGISMRAMEAGHDGHSHGGQEDPHFWLDPQRMKIHAVTIAAELALLDPTHAADFESNLKRLQAELDALDSQIRSMLAPLRGKMMLVFHPAFGYFAETYGLRQVSIETEGKEPGPKQMAQIIDQARREGVTTIFTQSQFSTKSAETVAKAIGAQVAKLDPLAYEYVRNMRTLAETVRSGMREKAE